MAIDFNEVMSKQTDEQLITILTVKRTDYTEPALTAAQKEVDKRNIPTDKIEKVQKEQAIIKEKIDALANEPLERDIKIMAIIFPLLARILNANKFRTGGYERKSAELSKAIMIGRFAYFGLIALIIILVKWLA